MNPCPMNICHDYIGVIMGYRKYDQRTMFLASKSGNPNLFPELKIPRTTAKYWIKNKIHLTKALKPKDCRRSEVVILREKLAKAKEENRKLRSQVQCMQAYLKILNKNKIISVIKNPLLQLNIVSLIRRYRGTNSVRSILKILNISFPKYKRWAKAIDKPDRGIEFQNSCRSLTFAEVMQIKEYFTSKKMFFYSIQALSTKAKINKDVYACPKTWSQYAKLLHLKRPNLKPMNSSKYPLGIQANKPNEIWHIDITEFKINKKKYFIQAIKDNYSRKILFWAIIDIYSANNTIYCLKQAIKEHGSPEKLMSDAGKENLNNKVTNYLKHHKIKHYVAKLNTRFSNSRIETYFRMIKSNYFSRLTVTSQKSLRYHFDFYTKQYNQEIPHSALQFRTPDEVFNGLNENFYLKLFQEYRKQTTNHRFLEFQK